MWRDNYELHSIVKLIKHKLEEIEEFYDGNPNRLQLVREAREITGDILEQKKFLEYVRVKKDFLQQHGVSVSEDGRINITNSNWAVYVNLLSIKEDYERKETVQLLKKLIEIVEGCLL